VIVFLLPGKELFTYLKAWAMNLASLVLIDLAEALSCHLWRIF